MYQSPNSYRRTFKAPRSFGKNGWFVATADVSPLAADYLHDDLNVCPSTQGTNTSGYFPTEEAAKKAILDYDVKWNCPTTKQLVNHQDAFDRAMKGI